MIPLPLLAVALNGFLARAFASGDQFAHAEFRGFWWSLGGISIAGLVILLVGFRVEKESAQEG